MDTKKTVLVIDDEETLRENVGYQFEAKGFEVIKAVDGIDALEKLETIKPDLITLDMNMPRMDGLEFYQKIKGDNEKPPYPVLVLTARANMEELFRQLDVDGFIAKPFEIDELIKEGEDIIKRNSRRIHIKGTEEDRSAKVCIVEDDMTVLKEMSFLFLESGFIINSAKTGASAMKRITMDLPDIVLVKLKLTDISGDMVILKLRQIEKTKETKCILYTSETAIDNNIAEKIGRKMGIAEIVNSNNPEELVTAADMLLQGVESKAKS